MAKFYVAGCFTDDIVVDRDRNSIEKKAGGPAHYVKRVFDMVGEDYEIAEGKKGIVEIHFEKGQELGRVPAACRLASAPITSSIVLVSSIANEINIDKLKGSFKELYVDARGFVRDPEHFGGKRKWELKNVDKITVLKTSQLDMHYLPENLLAHLRKNGVIIVGKSGGRYTLIDHGVETEYELGDVNVPQKIGAGTTMLAAFATVYAHDRNAKEAMKSAIEHMREFLFTSAT